jgi:methylthioribose-1-phosphate isomerase
MLKPVTWNQDSVRIIDQTRLPGEEVYLDIRTTEDMVQAIRRLAVRGAPAIGIAAAMSLALVARKHRGPDEDGLLGALEIAAEKLAASRPTAVNLFWAIERMRTRWRGLSGAPLEELRSALVQEAQAILEQDIASCRQIGQNGAALLPEEANVITLCNAGALATGAYGTALGVVRAAHEAGKRVRLFACETRPLMQGSRLTAWEMMRDGIDVTLMCDNMAAYLMSLKPIHACIVGADRITANGDTANKIGTYMLAQLARAHDVPFFVAAPLSTIDLSLNSGDQIPIEQRNPDEVRRLCGVPTSPTEVPVFNPAFDVTPARLIRAIITEKGVVSHPNMKKKLKELFKKTT